MGGRSSGNVQQKVREKAAVCLFFLTFQPNFSAPGSLGLELLLNSQCLSTHQALNRIGCPAKKTSAFFANGPPCRWVRCVIQSQRKDAVQGLLIMLKCVWFSGRQALLGSPQRKEEKN